MTSDVDSESRWSMSTMCPQTHGHFKKMHQVNREKSPVLKDQMRFATETRLQTVGSACVQRQDSAQKQGLREVVWVDFTQIQPRKASKRRQHAGEDFEPKVFFVTEPIGSSLDNSDLVVEPLDEAERDFVFLLAVGGDAIPMTIDHVGELLVGFQPLPFERGAPLLEEAPCPALVLVAPELAERFLEQVGGIEPFVGPQQCLQSLSALQRQIFLARQQRVF